MACTTCKQNIENIKIESSISEWITREEVKDICPSCYENMVNQNISKLKRVTFLEKLKEKEQIQSTKMKFNEIIFTGSANQLFNLGPYKLEPLFPIYLRDDEIESLGLTVEKVKNLPNIQVNILEADSKPDPIAVQAKLKKSLGQVGIMWVGPSPERHNELGRFPRNKVVWVSHEVSQKLITYGGFKIV